VTPLGVRGLHAGLVPRPLSAPQPEFVVSATHLVNPDAAVLDQPPAEVRTLLRGAPRQRLAEGLEGVRPRSSLTESTASRLRVRFSSWSRPRDSLLDSAARSASGRLRTARTKAACRSPARLSPRARATAELALTPLARGHDFLVYVPATLARSRAH
jgi:hypothetical protein